MYPIHLNNYFSTLPLDILLASSLLITVLARVQILFKRLLKESMSFELLIKKMKRLVAHLAKAYPGFPCINWWGVSLPPPPPRWDASLQQGYPPAFIRLPWQFAGTHLYSWVERDTVRGKCFSQITTHWPSQVSNPHLSMQSPAH